MAPSNWTAKPGIEFCHQTDPRPIAARIGHPLEWTLGERPMPTQIGEVGGSGGVRPGHAVSSAPPGALVATTTVLVCPFSRLPNGQLSTLAAMVHTPPGFVVMIQLFRLPNVGNSSLRTTLLARPGPVLVTTIVKLTLSPISYVPPFGLLVSV